MKIWVDADACPAVIKEILFRAAERTKIEVTLVANHPMHVPATRFVNFLQVAHGFDVADNAIVDRIAKDDLLITADIPLAAEVIDKGAHALNPRGELYAKDTIKARLGMRNLMETMRESGVQTGGPAPLSQKDRQVFANQLDRFLSRHRQQKKT